MNTIILVRRFTIVMLFAAIFAIAFSAAVEFGGPSGAQSHFGANFTCLQASSHHCTVVQ